MLPLVANIRTAWVRQKRSLFELRWGPRWTAKLPHSPISRIAAEVLAGDDADFTLWSDGCSRTPVKPTSLSSQKADEMPEAIRAPRRAEYEGLVLDLDSEIEEALRRPKIIPNQAITEALTGDGWTLHEAAEGTSSSLPPAGRGNVRSLRMARWRGTGVNQSSRGPDQRWRCALGGRNLGSTVAAKSVP